MQGGENHFNDFKFWKEYPERDEEFAYWYPPVLGDIDTNDIWSKKEIGLYVHIPFCKAICKYCPFNKYVRRERLHYRVYWKPEKAVEYLEALKKEIKICASKSYIQDSTIVTVYFGGGTPTCLTTEQLVDLIAWLKENFDISQEAEINIEVNPETAEEHKLKSLFDMGVNRVSFGVQSFNERLLKVIGRPHKADQALFAIELAKQK